MAMVVGSQKQEQKISELGKLANDMFPDHGLLAFKGCFRRGAQAALDQAGVSEWSEVAAWPADRRRTFFAKLLEGSRPCLQGMGMPAPEVNRLLNTLRQANERYLAG